MAINYDNVSSATVGTGNLSWTHSPSGTPRGVIVFVIQTGSGADQVSGVTYGGTTMTEVSGSPLLHTTGETGAVYCYFLGSSVPTGNQTVAVTVTGSATKAAVCFTVTADTTTVVIQDVDATINSDSLSNPSVTLSHGGFSCFDAIGLFSGVANVNSITALTSWTESYEYDFGQQQAGAYRYNTVGTSDATAGWTQGADDAVMIAIALRENIIPITAVGNIGSAQALGTPTVTPGTATVLPSGVGSAQAFGTTLLSLSVTSAGGIATTESFGTATVTGSEPTQTITSTGAIPSEEAFGTGRVTLGVIIDIDHETGDLTQYTTLQNSADLAVNETAKLAGTNYGLQITVDDNTPRYGQYNLGAPNTSGIVRARFYIDPNSLGNDGSDSANIFQPSTAAGVGFGYLILGYTGGSYYLRASIVNDIPGNVYSAIYNITDEPHYFEVMWVKASSADANDGYMSVWIDGVFKETVSNVDSYTRWDTGFQIAKLGFTYSTAAFNGTFFLDELVIRDDNNEIGGSAFVVVPGVASAESFGTAVVQPGAVSLTDVGNISSEEAFGSAVVSVGTVDIAPSSIDSAEAFGTATISVGSVDITVSSIDSAEAFGTANVSANVSYQVLVSWAGMRLPLTNHRTLYPSGIASSEAFGSATVSAGAVDIAPTGIASAESFGSPTLHLVLFFTGIPTAETFGTPVLTTGAVNISPSGIATAESFGDHVVSVGTAYINPTGIASQESFGTPQVASLETIVYPSGIASTEAFGTPVITVGATSVYPTGIASAESFGTAEITTGAVSVLPGGIASAESFGTATVSVGVTLIYPSGIASAESVSSPVVATGAVTIAPTSITTQEAFGTPTISTGSVNVAPTGIATAEAFGEPTIVLYVVSQAISSAEAFGTPTVSVGTAYILPGGIASAQAFGNAIVSAGESYIVVPGIASAESFGTPTVQPGTAFVQPTSISGAEAFGTLRISLFIYTYDIASSELFGTPTFVYEAAPTGIGSGEAFGDPALGFVVFPAGITTSEFFGDTTVTVGGVFVYPSGISTLEQIGNANVQLGLQTIVNAGGISSAELFGLPVLYLEWGETIVGIVEITRSHSAVLFISRNHNGIVNIERDRTVVSNIEQERTGDVSVERVVDSVLTT